MDYNPYKPEIESVSRLSMFLGMPVTVMVYYGNQLLARVIGTVQDLGSCYRISGNDNNAVKINKNWTMCDVSPDADTLIFAIYAG